MLSHCPECRLIKILALDSVDRKFTTLVERLFTNAFDVTGAERAGACVYRARNAD
jgi:hypothetical protein